MEKDSYTINCANGIFNIFKNKTLLNTIKKIGSPTSNCQVQSIMNLNNIKVLSDENILFLFSETYRYNAKKLYLLEISNKIVLKKFLNFIKNNDTRFSIIQNNEFKLSKSKSTNTLLIKYTKF